MSAYVPSPLYVVVEPGANAATRTCRMASVWTLHIDPLLSILLGAVPSYFFGVWFTENIFAQKPLVTQAACPNCGALNTVFFGDLFNVMSDGLAGPPAPPGNTVVTKCTSCKAELSCDREALVISTTVSKVPAK